MTKARMTRAPKPSAVTWLMPSSRWRRVLIAWIVDRREQYQPSSGSYEALCQIIEGLREGRDLDAYEHGELDDLLADDGYPTRSRK